MGLFLQKRLKHIKMGKQRRHFEIEFFSLLADLLEAGFSLPQSIEFMLVLLPNQADRLVLLKQQLSSGKELADAFFEVGINADVVSQIRITEKHGDLQQSLKQIGRLLLEQEKQKRQLKRLLRYPFVLLLLLGGLIFFVKQMIEPELLSWQANMNQNVLLYWRYFGLSLAGIGLVSLIFYLKLLFEKNPLKRAIFCNRLPLVGRSYREYYHYYLLFNLGTLLKNGLNLQEICQLLTNFSENSLLYQLGKQIQPQLAEGKNLANIVTEQALFPDELALFVQKGETKEFLGEELIVQARLTYRKMLQEIERIVTYVQPFFFGIIALTIIGVYLSILLPLYQMMEGMY
ncbi:competence type IV pilus assembly protein ComGB [Loigolactobacillus iwatensis]|uniref:competence type IV pilus assembly protein ComGB n=1 Tax=Loigolactobacillus iwatensis TaxID=1267156 RepID=UPI000F7DB23D|nr:competence type IV pilus assembly protein ComGB [Loigolactobacillus iwatensis]